MSIDSGTIESEKREARNWLPMVIAAAVVLVVAGVGIALLQHGKKAPAMTPLSAPLDAYAGNLPISRLAMSESANLAGGKVTYIDGHIVNTGQKTISAVTVQVLFRNFAHEVTQNDTQPLKLIRVRDPYVDVQPVSASPIKPGDDKEFRLSFDGVKPDWDGAFPEIRILRVDAK